MKIRLENTGLGSNHVVATLKIQKKAFCVGNQAILNFNSEDTADWRT